MSQVYDEEDDDVEQHEFPAEYGAGGARVDSDEEHADQVQVIGHVKLKDLDKNALLDVVGDAFVSNTKDSRGTDCTHD